MRVSRKNFLVFSDDLTGANGVSGMMSRFSRAVTVPFDKIHYAPTDDFRCITVNTKSRMRDGENAYRIISSLLENLKGKGTYIGKRMDSTLRGNIEKEAIPLISNNVAIMTDTIPEYGRFTRDGMTISGDVYLEISAIFRELEVIPLRIEDLKNTRMERGRVYVVDSATYEDLEKIALFTYRNRYLPMDPGPLCSLVARLHVGENPVRNSVPGVRSVSYIIGSMEKKTETQIEYAVSRGVRMKMIEELREENVKALIIRLDYMRHRNLLNENFIKLVSNFDSFVLSGGETANTIFDSSGGIYLESLGDFMPLVGIGRVHGGLLDGKILVTKGGMIGPENIYITILDSMLSDKNGGKDRNNTG